MEENKFMDVTEAAKFLGLSRAYLYKLTCARLIPYYKPRGGKMLFDRHELEDYVRNGRVDVREDVESMAARYDAERVG